MANWQDDFHERYVDPRIENVTVGFSGVDPNSLPTSLTDEQLAIVTNLILKYLSKLTIKIDSGDITPGSPPPEVQPVTLKPSEIPHEMLNGLLGGNDEGHYHLTDEELAKLHAYPEIENLNALLKHEGLPDLQGGENGGHYHLTQAELQRLKNIVDALIPDKDTNVVKLPQTIQNHEQLSGLKGGAANEHYHFKLDEWSKLLKVLDALFPAGATEPKFPSVPSNPDTPSNPDDPVSGGSEWGGLPAGSPPQWTRANMPDRTNSAKYTCHAGVHKMYYGQIPISGNPTALLVPMIGKNLTETTFMYTEKLTSWEQLKTGTTGGSTRTISKFGKNVGQYLYRVYSAKGYRYLYFLAYPTTKDEVWGFRFSSSRSWFSLTNSSDAGTTSWLAGCYSSDLKIHIFVSKSGKTCQLPDSETVNVGNGKYWDTKLTAINPGCAAWLPTKKYFCVAGPSGVSISSDGKNWSPKTVAAIPKNLQDLTWRTDFKSPCLHAWREEDRKFYISADGINWQTDGNLPSTAQVSKIAAVAYNPDYKEYCVIGGSSQYAYLSADLKTWRQTEVSNAAAVPMGSVIWMPSTKKYVLMPTSGESYYTFDRPAWKE